MIKEEEKKKEGVRRVEVSGPAMVCRLLPAMSLLLQVQLRKDRGRTFQFPSLKSKMRIQSGQRRMVQVDFLSTSRFGVRDTTTS